MGLILALKAFFKALKEPQKAQEFLDEKSMQTNSHDYAHLRLLALLQHSGRLIDFLKEDISQYNDAQVGSAVRKIHQDCSKTLEETVTIRPIREENEGEKVNIHAGYDPATLKIVGKVKGEPPFHGTLIHKGWKAHKHSLPKKIGDQQNEVICPAEVEVV